MTHYFDGLRGELVTIVIDMGQVSASVYDTESNFTVFRFKEENSNKP